MTEMLLNERSSTLNMKLGKHHIPKIYKLGKVFDFTQFIIIKLENFQLNEMVHVLHFVN